MPGNTPPNKPVIVVGAGIVGICSALSMLEKGIAVEIVDRDAPASGASHGNAGVISPWSCVPQSVPGLWRNVPKWVLHPDGPVALRWSYALRFLPWAVKFLRAGKLDKIQEISDAMHVLQAPGIDLYTHHLKGTGHEDLIVPSRYLFVYRDADQVEEGGLAWQLRAQRGAVQEVVMSGDLRDLEPDLSPDYIAAIMLHGQARATDPGGVGQALMEKALSMGAKFHRTMVHSIRPDDNDGWILETGAGQREAQKLVLAAGAWSARLLEPLGIKVSLEAERGYHLVLRDPGISLNNSIMDTACKFVASSMQTGVRCAGTAEFAGLEAPPDYRRAYIFKKLATRLFPNINVEDPSEWMGVRPSMPDSLPCLGAVPGFANLITAFGHSHFGFSMGPGTGRIVAELVSEATPNIDLTAFRIDRFN